MEISEKFQSFLAAGAATLFVSGYWMFLNDNYYGLEKTLSFLQPSNVEDTVFIENRLLSYDEREGLIYHLSNSKEVASVLKDTFIEDNIEIMKSANEFGASISNNTCYIGIKNDPSWFFSDNNDYLSEKAINYIKPKNAREHRIGYEFAAQHEIAHCKFFDYKAPIVLSKSEQYNNILNDLTYTLKSDLKTNSIYKMSNELYADALSGILTMKRYPNNGLDVLKKVMVARISTKNIANDPTEEHSANFYTIQLILTKEYQDKIKNIDNKDGAQMEKMALEIANKSLRLHIASLTPHQKQAFFDLDAITSPIFKNIILDIYSKRYQNSGSHFNPLEHGYKQATLYTNQLSETTVENFFDSIEKNGDKKELEKYVGWLLHVNISNEDREQVKERLNDKYREKLNDALKESFNNLYHVSLDTFLNNIFTELSSENHNEIGNMKIDTNTEEISNISHVESNTYYSFTPTFNKKIEKLSVGYTTPKLKAP